MSSHLPLAAGDPAPTFVQRSPSNPRYTFDTAAGRYLVLALLPGAQSPEGRAALAAVAARRQLFDDRFACLFVASADPDDEAAGRPGNSLPGIRCLWDGDRKVARLYGAAPREGEGAFLPRLVVIDPTMRVIEVAPLTADPEAAGAALDRLARLPPPERFAGIELQAPVLFLPRVFEPELCARLIAAYEAQGGEVSGFMREEGGRTVGVHDTRHKSRRDVTVSDPALVQAINDRIRRRVVPEIAKVHQFRATRMERYLVGCYDAGEGGHFAPHRDNTTPGTAHRRFAVSINLNDDFEGGEVSFPEYGPRGFKAPTGGAVVFSCSLLHAVSRVTRGRRYAFLPFLYDDAAAAIRDANRGTITA
ncbi:MAG: 2OG-Fe(II) oxygenase [Rhodobacteraceae bacterium]|nr:2OG-Fe(II) oxygenase [Paracoccaceae bacterium]